MSARLLQSIDVKTRLLLGAFLVVYLALPFALNPTTNLTLDTDAVLLVDSVEVVPQALTRAQLNSVQNQWRAVTLPFHWRGQFANQHAVWYRATLPLDALPSAIVSNSTREYNSLGIYLWRLNQTADIWVNGVAIGSGGRTDGPIARYWNTPLYFSVPSSLLGENNEILIKHYAEHGWGSMEPIVFGPDQLLRPVYERRQFIQHDLALGLFVFVLVTGSLSLMVWIYRRRETEYLWFAIASFGLSIYCLNQFIRYLPMNPEVWRWLLNTAIDLWAVATFIFILRSLRIVQPTMERAALIYLGLGIPLYCYASFGQVFDINIYYHLGSVVLGAIAIATCIIEYRRNHNLLPAFYCFTLILAVTAGIHDILMQAAVNIGWSNELLPGFENHFNFTHFGAPLIFLLIAANLMKRFVLTMNAADETNEQLELRVAEARAELDENYRAMEAVLKQQSAQEERERIYRDLHDDVGSKLLSLYYRLDRDTDSVLAKSALEDLRDIVSHKSLDGCTLADALLQWRAEAEERVADAGVQLTWSSDVNSQGETLSELQRTQLRRMLREVLSNAILHSKPLTHIKIRVTINAGKLIFCVDNDGVRTPPADWRTGRGISNLRVRARDLAGSFELLDLEKGWVRAVWRVPLQPSANFDEAVQVNHE